MATIFHGIPASTNCRNFPLSLIWDEFGTGQTQKKSHYGSQLLGCFSLPLSISSFFSLKLPFKKP
jgi:hypothetical protein